jgi:hypothetical protein
MLRRATKARLCGKLSNRINKTVSRLRIREDGWLEFETTLPTEMQNVFTELS